MAFGFDRSSYDAVFFVDDMQVIREMLFTEFEALLDGMFYDADFKNSTCQAVYLKIDKKLNISGAVFFTLDFDEQGQADKRWNIPLIELAASAAHGVKLNGKKIRIACHSQCQIPWQQSELWEPDLSNRHNILSVLAESVKANRLGLLVSDTLQLSPDEEEESAAVNSSHSKSSESFRKASVSTTSVSDGDLQHADERKRTAKFMRQLRARISRLKVVHKRDCDNIHADTARQATALTDINEDNERKLFRLQVAYDKKTRDADALRAEHETQLEEAIYKHGQNHEKLRRQLRQDLQQRLIEETSELQAKLEMREVEVHYREEQISRLQTQLAELRRVDTSEQQSVGTFEELEQRGVRYVVKLEGLEAIQVPAEKIASYYASPERYLAEYLKVDFNNYQRWSVHANHPVCSAKTQGAHCQQMIEVSTPNNFVAGVSDRCNKHQVKPATVLGSLQANA